VWLVAALGLLVGISASAVTAQPPATHVWEQVCENAAGGELSPQPALVCVNTEPWSRGAEVVLQHVCEHALGGAFVQRSEFPDLLAGCFFD
jgi:hypothetical protein